MRNSLTDADAKLLVDLETGRVLRGDDNPTVSRRWLDSHPFVSKMELNLVDAYLVGPDAHKEVRGITNGGDFFTYTVERDVAGAITLQRLVEA